MLISLEIFRPPTGGRQALVGGRPGATASSAPGDIDAMIESLL